jgi:hypothetical protein
MYKGLILLSYIGAVYAYAYIIYRYSIYIIGRYICICTYMDPHWKLLH